MEARAAHHTALSSAAAGPLWVILREAVTRAPGETKRMVAFGVFAWIGVIALQAYDSADASGAAGVAEFLSAVCASAGGTITFSSGAAVIGVQLFAGYASSKGGVWNHTSSVAPWRLSQG